MKVEKLLEDIVKLESRDIYTTDIKGTLLRLLNEKYKSKNFKGCHILSVIEIVRHSSRDISHTNEAFVTVTCLFKVECYVFDMGEVIFCKIIKKEVGQTHGINEYACIKIANTAKYDSFVIGSIAPVVVHTAVYEVGQSEVTIIAIPFVPSPRIIYRVSENDYKTLESGENKEYFDHIKKRITAEQKKMSTRDKSTSFFLTLTDKKLSGRNIFDNVSFIEQGALVSSEPNSSVLNLFTTSKPTDTKTNIYDEKLSIIVIKLMHNHLKYLMMINNLVKHYPSSSDIKELALTWKLYKYYGQKN